MSLGHGASIVRNGLVFQYDMANTVKSWKGKPTTNILANPLNPTTWAMYTDPTYGFVSDEYFTYNGVLGKNIPAYRRTVSGADYRATRIDIPWTTPTNMSTPITASIYVRCLNPDPGGATTVNINFQGVDSQGARVDTTTAIPVVNTDWIRLTDTETLSTSGFIFLVNYMKYYIVGDTTVRTWEVMMPQVEIESFATPFVDGTRSNTEAIIDISRQNNTVTTSNLVYNTDGTFEFNGSSSTLNLGYVPELLSADITQEAWVRADSFTNWHGIISNMSSWGTGFSLQIGTEQNIAAMVSGSYLKTSWVPSINTWYHICATHRSSDDLNVLYVNGIQEASTTRAISYEANAETKIGCFYTIPSLFLDGKISSIRTYNRALTPEEVIQNFEATRGRYGI